MHRTGKKSPAEAITSEGPSSCASQQIWGFSAALRGAVGASDGGPVADAMTTQLVQTMAAHGADSGVERLHTAVQAEPQQQPLLTTPHA